MNRRFATVPLSALCLLFALAGCQKSADQQQAAATDANSSSPDSGASSSKPAVRETPPRPRPIVVPAETVISVVLDESVGSKISSPGQQFSASAREPVEVDGRVAIPKGARATGIVKPTVALQPDNDQSRPKVETRSTTRPSRENTAVLPSILRRHCGRAS